MISRHVNYSSCSDVTEYFSPFHYYKMNLYHHDYPDGCIFIGQNPLVASRIVSCDSSLPSEDDMAKLERTSRARIRNYCSFRL